LTNPEKCDIDRVVVKITAQQHKLICLIEEMGYGRITELVIVDGNPTKAERPRDTVIF